MSQAEQTTRFQRQEPARHEELAALCASVRAHTERLAAPLSPEDQTVQSMPDASPTKWHRAHTSWFFEHFVLGPNLPHYRLFDPDFSFLFNSYYEAVGPRHPRPMRGLLTRPDCARVAHYRAHVDAGLQSLLREPIDKALDDLITLGLQHEQQHQELLLTDALHLLSQNPLAWQDNSFTALPGWPRPATPTLVQSVREIESPGGIAMVGHDGAGFGFDCEFPRHRTLLQPHGLANRLIRNREWLEFIEDGGYRRADLWMSDGWTECCEQNWQHPLHWREDGSGGWLALAPGGVGSLSPERPVDHVSWYEADAFARWRGARLPTEDELEAADQLPEFFGHAWQWTNSAYLAYPRFAPAGGAIGEYNGKFMINQMVLRGSSYATSPGHARKSYRNFFPPAARWQVAGVRLAFDR